MVCGSNRNPVHDLMATTGNIRQCVRHQSLHKRQKNTKNIKNKQQGVNVERNSKRGIPVNSDILS